LLRSPESGHKSCSGRVFKSSTAVANTDRAGVGVAS